MKNFDIVDKFDELWTVKVHPATTFNAVVEEILKMRNDIGFGANIEFEFSNIKLLATKESTLESLQEQYSAGLEKKHIEHLNSQEYKDIKEQSEKLEQKYQVKGKELLGQFDEALQNVSHLVKWIGEFSIVTDSTKLDYSPKELAQKMKDKGFDYEVPDIIDLDYTVKELIGRSVIANAFIALSDGHNINYMADKFAHDYQALEEKEKVLAKIGNTRNTYFDNKATNTPKNN